MTTAVGRGSETRRGSEKSSAGAATSPFAARVARLREELAAAGVRALLVTHLPNLRYLAGFSGSNGLLLVEPSSILLVTDFRYEEQAGAEVPRDVTVRIAKEGLIVELAEWMQGAGVGGLIGFEADHVTVRDRRELGERCGGVSWEAVAPIVERLRATKDGGERERIRRAARIADEALAETLETVRPGLTEREVAAELEYRLRLAGSDTPPFETIVAAGPRSALPHARPSGRRLRSGDLVLLDFGARVDGYCSDMTRTVVLGPAAIWQRETHAAVRRALETALSGIAPGRPARDVDAAARGSLAVAGLGDHFGHSTGHGIGLEVHEAPRLHRSSEEVLAEGNVVTVEPGVYLAGRGGVRIEEDVAVVAGGCEPLTGFPRDLLEI